MRQLLLLGWAWICAGEVGSDDPLPGKLDGEVLLKPINAPAKITSITWKYGPNLAVQWEGSDITYYRHFKDRANLSVETGILEIQNLVLSDSNDYTPEINNVLQRKIVLKVYRPVPEPEIKVKCFPKTNCVLTCFGDITDAEPVTYCWRDGIEALQESSNRLTLEWDKCSRGYTCTMTNPVSTMRSKSVTPLSSDKLKQVIPSVVVPILSIGAIIVIHKFLTGVWFFQKDEMCWKADFWKKSTNQSGNGQDKEEAQTMAKDND